MRKSIHTVTKKAAAAGIRSGQSSVESNDEKMTKFRTYVYETISKYQTADSNIIDVDQTPMGLNLVASG
jgi:hypothetical protein